MYVKLRTSFSKTLLSQVTELDKLRNENFEVLFCVVPPRSVTFTDVDRKYVPLSTFMGKVLPIVNVAFKCRIGSAYHQSAEEKETAKSKSLKPPKSPSVSSKRKRTSEAGDLSISQDAGISPEDVWVRKVTTTTTPEEETSAEVREENANKAAEPIMLPIDAAATPATTPPATEPVMIKDDNESTDEELLAKKTKTSTSKPPPSSQPAKALGKKTLNASSRKPEPLLTRSSGATGPQDKEIQHLKGLLQQKEAWLQQTSELPAIKAELERVKGDYLRAVNDLKLANKKKKVLDEENEELYDNVHA
ncbi:hypothetical protein RND71_040901 [Anisodus tanguticus]|uniref:Uncharacterized protein n=1 Tax=Anisodus tanguticus TaxID=243964 RepID=A0AAE1QUF3_9SOLA|nr:hypothetical protein RND71_040901 [Anisodus tanguticus]